METKGLDEILNDDPQTETPEPIVEPKSDIHEESPLLDRPRDEMGRFAPKDAGVEPPTTEQPAAPPAAEPATGLPPHEFAALKDERRKRQEAEARAAFLEQQLRQPPPATEAEPVDFWENPNAVISNQVNQAVNTALQEWERRQVQQRAEAAEAAARAKYPDYDDAFAKFREQLQFNPALMQDLNRAADPAEFAYQRGRAAIDMADPESYRAKIEAEVRQKLEAELLANAPRPQTLPPTTAGQRSVSGRGGPQWGGPPGLKDILA